MRAERPLPELLRTAPLFAALPDAEIGVLSRCVEGRRYEAGERVLEEGEPGDSMIFLIEGTLVATARTPAGREVELNRMQAGEVAGEMAFLDPAPRSASVRAATAAVVYVLGHDAARVLRVRAPAALRALIGVAIGDMTRRLRNLERRIDDELARGAPP